MPEHNQVSPPPVVCLIVCYSLPRAYLPTNKFCQILEIVNQHNTHGWRCSCASKIAYMISRECLYFFRYDIATIFAVELFRFRAIMPELYPWVRYSIPHWLCKFQENVIGHNTWRCASGFGHWTFLDWLYPLSWPLALWFFLTVLGTSCVNWWLDE
jgi:hypothetical protein